MSTTTPKTAFWRGVRDSAPFTLIAGPFALLFGVIATEAGLNLFEVMTFSLAVIAGAAQFTALQLMQENAPTVVVIISALAVNLRVAMYSAALTPYLGRAPMWQRVFAAYLLVDQSYALSHQKFEAEPEMTVPERMGYYMGTCLLVMSVWYGASLAGAIIGSALPPQIPIDFALPIAFLAMVAPALRTLPHVIAAFTAVVVSLFAASVPWSLGLIIAGAAGMIAGAQAELWMERRT
ncbi:AzlC family ABC transporter permease [Sulfitobacter pseudonitzschiae]|uniref:AzlC family ABC transporter permease n=1 Tax=Pseudosulfitobacter pseudonitzschiae TaxID=1402135 RepID=A0A9Q2NLS2_9RHOB|nr:AzlC family ABC transporter permease [Pseudosulfitobacter pseudonitzschiae]MBM2291901.1 AzlC family ABC transporter permease [Pseudosulfitobacter pseudonitzschiae]MBM2296819.1 AzlC family ABC transporter permease [Pseudosulfitobacter pseudonitzschiae]MBM2301732.1 AzlC family ABC transporter permease [Pseudosulfitobacter pseudonitzschiae]MBM2311515.1 AzlC family ABC transporter permease [Pseudosulfitobacter pseudonitzschiae]MBM2316429.1 AzlC family ABC transporter permease [Pseudosulfitobact